MPAVQLSQAANGALRHLFSARDSFDDDYNRARKQAQAIGGGVIAVIVIIIVIIIGSVIAAFCICSRRKSRRAKQELEMKNYVGGVPVAGAATAGNMNGQTHNGENEYGYSRGYVANDGKNAQNASDAMPPAYTAGNNGSTPAN
ncbi:hypothetical protein CORC01_07583 [Colletotrichum orchidophilum]|uniref:Uncharacterized protein n=1 Tax=Colletotrichum orchidophilum TaxID=1209926 RepID=A0A1G4B782_9PEZI|nr:uncharacterized protein CORC01_07583 [Colletotrichum orchidophilum]OHE97142.1 hypothetical protein CORC01_07583 [Colletotrichum orchidophilum]